MRKLVLLLFAACAACGCGAQPGMQPATAPAVPTVPTAPAAPAPAAGAPATGTSPALARIHELVGTPSCSSDAQCHTLAIGAKACGGPESYLAWSSAGTPESALRAFGEHYKQERRAANTASGKMSTCNFLADPGAACKAGTCQLNAPMQAR